MKMVIMIYNPKDISSLLYNIDFIKTNKKISYGNIAISFDIETTSFYEDKEKRATMYAWTFNFNGTTIIGRTWDEFIELINELVTYYDLNDSKRLIIYVHNFEFEFQFINRLFKWTRVFSIDSRRPVQAITDTGIEFRCSYILSGYSLQTVAKNLTTHKINKLVGDLDYSLYRHTTTPLTDNELKYIEYDGLIVVYYIQELINQYGDITKLPLTKTGFVRNFVRNQCFYENGNHKKANKFKNYKRIINNIPITSVNEYDQLKRAFQGGFTHANALYVNRLVYDVTSYDFTSSYPYVIVARQYPMGRGYLIKIKDINMFSEYIRKYSCIFDIEFINIRPRLSYDFPISLSKCTSIENYIVNNGRVVEASKLKTTITEQDYFIYQDFYVWDKIRIKNFRYYMRGYLPTDFIRAVLKLYNDKTKLKGVEGKEVEYLKGKEYINSCYGMMVTDICRDEIEFDGTEWKSKPVDYAKAINSYNKSIKRFLAYQWGVWVTAYARRNLFSGIKAFGNDYVYSDTDSLKSINTDTHIDYINSYNNNVLKYLNKAMEYHHFSIDLCMPKTIKGVTKILGVWDYDGHYDIFKTLGAKRYVCLVDNDIDITISGLNGKYTIPYLYDNYKTPLAIFNAFDNNLVIPSYATGKKTHTYIDFEMDGYLTDYLGNTNYYHEYSGTHLENAEYSLSLAANFMNYLKGVQEKYI